MNFSPVNFDGAFFIDKKPGITSFGIVEELKRTIQSTYSLKGKDLPKIGHGGTLDPFASGLLVILVGRGVKLAQYFLGSDKAYDGVVRFGETTVSGDVSDPISATTPVIPQSLDELKALAETLTKQTYLQTPPMHSAKKHQGKPLYELARLGIEVERKPVECQLYTFEVSEFAPPRARIFVKCSSGTYIRTLAQDYAKLLGSLGVLESLRRTGSGGFDLKDALTLEEAKAIIASRSPLEQVKGWVPFNGLLNHFPRAEINSSEVEDLLCGRQRGLSQIAARASGAQKWVGLFHQGQLRGILKKESFLWKIDRVFSSDEV